MNVLIFLRFSVSNQQSNSALLSCKDYASDKDWNVSNVISRVQSGDNSDLILEILDNLNDINVVLTNSIDRISRDPRLTIYFLEQLESLGIDVHTVKEGQISSTLIRAQTSIDEPISENYVYSRRSN